MFKFDLGCKVKDKENGAIDTVRARAEYLDENNQYYMNSTGWTDEDNLEAAE
jgi:hypothetical protein